MDDKIPETRAQRKEHLLEVTRLFLRLGLTAFGGPAAHIAMMHNEVVIRRKWMSEQDFLDLFGAANLIPGPTSTEMAIYLGIQRAGWAGLALAGLCFILPAMLIVLGLAWIYVSYGSTPPVIGVVYGIKPVVLAIIIQALWNLGRKAVNGWLAALIGLAVVVLYVMGANVLVLLLAAGLVVMLVRNCQRLKELSGAGSFLPFLNLAAPAVIVPFSLPLLFLTFFKVGAVLYGSGYVLLAFLRSDFVVHLGWLTDQQLIDAIAIGQATPGPLSTTATFIGYLVGGVPGAVLATLAIFLPSFIFVALSSRLIPYIRRSPWISSLLDGVTIASLGLMAGVTLQLGLGTLTITGAFTAASPFFGLDPLAIVLMLAGLVLLFRFNLNSTWLIAGGAVVGIAHLFMRG